MNKGPLDGFRVLDLSRVLSGPAATMLLADQGADVIKVEPPEGDITRGMGTAEGNVTAFFLNINRGKRDVCVNLKTEEGRDIVRRIATTADVLVQNFRPGVMEKLGLGYEDIRETNGKIIYVSISGFGKHGPYAQKRVYDPVIQALSGMTDIQADHEERIPRMMRTVIPDKTTALTTAQAITAALLGRERTGEGQHIELNMLDATVAFMWPEGMMRLTVVGDEPDGTIGQIAQDLVFKTTDGFITVASMSNDQWAGACRALNKTEWINDPRFATTAARFENIRVRLEGTAEIIATESSVYWLEKFESEGVPCAPVLSRLEMLDHEQILVNDTIQTYEHPVFGKVRQPRPAARMRGMPEQPQPLAPSLGEHNGEVLREIGFSVEEIARLQENGDIAEG
ncbi:MAG: CoA transferase [Pseudomonadota bacterium]